MKKFTFIIASASIFALSASQAFGFDSSNKNSRKIAKKVASPFLVPLAIPFYLGLVSSGEDFYMGGHASKPSHTKSSEKTFGSAGADSLPDTREMESSNRQETRSEARSRKSSDKSSGIDTTEDNAGELEARKDSVESI